ncbi:MAG: hypothetical protein AVDCRST_MAG49-2126, partial [uncultured Thermomicrobiales bacterium]
GQVRAFGHGVPSNGVRGRRTGRECDQHPNRVQPRGAPQVAHRRSSGGGAARGPRGHHAVRRVHAALEDRRRARPGGDRRAGRPRPDGRCVQRAARARQGWADRRRPVRAGAPAGGGPAHGHPLRRHPLPAGMGRALRAPGRPSDGPRQAHARRAPAARRTRRGLQAAARRADLRRDAAPGGADAPAPRAHRHERGQARTDRV